MILADATGAFYFSVDGERLINMGGSTPPGDLTPAVIVPAKAKAEVLPETWGKYQGELFI